MQPTGSTQSNDAKAEAAIRYHEKERQFHELKRELERLNGQKEVVERNINKLKAEVRNREGAIFRDTQEIAILERKEHQIQNLTNLALENIRGKETEETRLQRELKEAEHAVVEAKRVYEEKVKLRDEKAHVLAGFDQAKGVFVRQADVEKHQLVIEEQQLTAKQSEIKRLEKEKREFEDEIRQQTHEIDRLRIHISGLEADVRKTEMELHKIL